MKYANCALAVLLAASLVGCASQKRASTAARAQTELLGMSKRDLLTCAGAPHRQANADDLEFLTYSGGGDSVGSAVITQTSPTTAVAAGRSNRRYCEATFVLKNGVVQKVNYQGRTGGFASQGEQCAFIVENCIKP